MGEINKLVARWVRPKIRQLSAYHVADAEGLVKLDAMENPYRWPETLREEWLDLLREVEINRYPHPQAPGVKAALRRSMSIPEDMELVLGNGSDELIQMIAMTVAGPDRRVLSVEPSFVMYRMIATFLGMEYQGVSLRPDFSLDMDTLLSEIERTQPALIFLAYPNNPTGNLFRQEEMVEVVESAPGLVVIDEAYAPFTDVSFIPRLGRYDNLLVMRTVSKMGLAGLRLGLLAGPAAWLNEIEKTRLPYNINVLTQISAEFSLSHQSVFDSQTAAIRQARDQLFKQLQQIPGVKPFASQANFILVRLAPARAGKIFDELRQCGILVKNLDGSHPLLADCLRVTVGTPEENAAFLAAFKP
ncbi:MAG: histidinol-phosphate transaminase [Gammaproteobacteria bacterium]|nr:histidinol-phosphate transaminase [Gammaproteobacteria bacterium]HXK55361.1 histidinol-phosphate transaminase [Gammaproteobacteria bacterium]